MAKAYKRLRRERTERRLKNQSFMEPSKRPLSGKRKKSFIRSLFSNLVGLSLRLIASFEPCERNEFWGAAGWPR
jgi:hypothetical protein